MQMCVYNTKLKISSPNDSFWFEKINIVLRLLNISACSIEDHLSNYIIERCISTKSDYCVLHLA